MNIPKIQIVNLKYVFPIKDNKSFMEKSLITCLRLEIHKMNSESFVIMTIRITSKRQDSPAEVLQLKTGQSELQNELHLY